MPEPLMHLTPAAKKLPVGHDGHRKHAKHLRPDRRTRSQWDAAMKLDQNHQRTSSRRPPGRLWIWTVSAHSACRCHLQTAAGTQTRQRGICAGLLALHRVQRTRRGEDIGLQTHRQIADFLSRTWGRSENSRGRLHRKARLPDAKAMPAPRRQHTRQPRSAAGTGARSLHHSSLNTDYEPLSNRGTHHEVGLSDRAVALK